ncbi:MAG: ester cyclase [Gemmatimonadetes bacterium]|nr:ester cyclase [Gemmatimonadota bacterium]
MNPADTDRATARLQIVEEHIRHENNHDLEGILSTFGESALYEEQPWGERHDGLRGVREYYEALIAALPDLHIEVQTQHTSGDAIILEVVISGTHQAPWRGLPATGRKLEFPLCAVYTFTDDDRLAGERIYYDRATVFRQLGVFHEPQSALGQLTTAVAHPITIARAFLRHFVSRRGNRVAKQRQ